MNPRKKQSENSNLIKKKNFFTYGRKYSLDEKLSIFLTNYFLLTIFILFLFLFNFFFNYYFIFAVTLFELRINLKHKLNPSF